METGECKASVSKDVCGAAPKESVVFDAEYQRCKSLAEDVFLEYKQLYRQMVDGLSVNHLEPFENVLRENGGIVLENKAELIKALQDRLFNTFLVELQDFWERCDVADSLTTLSMLKNECKEYEGIKWNMSKKTPNERMLPIRMHFKETKLRYLQKQLQYQNKLLEDALQENSALREGINDISQRRILLKEKMNVMAGKSQHTKNEILKMNMELFDDSDDDNQNEEANEQSVKNAT